MQKERTERIESIPIHSRITILQFCTHHAPLLCRNETFHSPRPIICDGYTKQRGKTSSPLDSSRFYPFFTLKIVYLILLIFILFLGTNYQTFVQGPESRHCTLFTQFDLEFLYKFNISVPNIIIFYCNYCTTVVKLLQFATSLFVIIVNSVQFLFPATNRKNVLNACLLFCVL